MALSRSEIELLIRARDEAKGTFDNLNRVIKSTAQETAGASSSMKTLGDTTKNSGAQAVAAGVVFGNLATIVGRQLIQGFQDSIAAANKLDAGLIGLSSVANAFGQNADLAKAAAVRLASDGLMSVGDAATALKNLLAAGFGLDQAITLVERFKDTAAFGRQAALGFGQAISSATEGIKNGNSTLVDNAGVTKNLSNILVEAGFAATDLSKATTDVNIRQALFNGLVKETTPQLGDAARLLKTAAGQQAVFNAQVEIAQQKIGKALQPALADVLQILVPFTKAVGNAADILVPLGFATAAIVGPLLAVKAAAALGIPSIGGLGTQMASTLAIFGGVRSFGDARAGVQRVGEQAGLTTANLGKMGTAVSLVGAAFIGWQIGKVIDNLTGLSGVVERFVGASNRLALANEGAANKQDLLTRASEAAGRSITNVTEAVKITTAVEDIRRAQFEKSAAAQLKRVDAELLLGRITLEQANAQRLVITNEQSAIDIRAKRVKMTDVVAASEKKYTDEIKATGFTQRELIDQMAKDEVGFTSWAKQIGLTDDTVKRLKDSLTEHKAATTKAREESAKMADAWRELSSVGAGLAGTLDTIGGAVVEGVKFYLQAGVSQTALQKIYGLTDAQLKAISGTLEKETEAQKQADDAAKKYGDSLEEMASVGEGWKGTLETINGDIVQAIKYYLDAGVSQEDLATAYELTASQIKAVSRALTEQQKADQETRRSVEETKDLWNEYYGLIAEGSGRTVDYQISQIDRWKDHEIGQLKANDANWADHYNAIQAVAHEKVQAIIRENDPLWQAWQKLTGDLTTTLAGSFTDMLTGAKGFKDGFLGIWDGLKQSLKDILNDLLKFFVGNFLKGMLGSMSGQQGAFGAAFGGLFGGGGGGGGKGGGLGGIFGGLGGLFGGGGGGLPAGAQGPLQAGAGGLGGLTGALGSFGKMIPVIGTVIGAIGLLAPLLKNIGGPSKQELAGRGTARDAEDAILQSTSAEQHAAAGGERWKEVLITVRDAYLGIGKSSADAERDVARLWAAEKQGPGAVKAVYDEIAASMEVFRTQQDKATTTVTDQTTETAEAAAAGFGAAVIDIKRSLAELGPEAQDIRREIEDTLGRIRITIPVQYDVPPPPDLGGGEPPPDQGAAAGIFASGRAAVATWFGEGGEPEVGGPASFFKRIFESLGVGGTQTAGGPGGVVVNNYFSQTVDRAMIETVAIPMIVDAVSGNKRQARTNLRGALGVA